MAARCDLALPERPVILCPITGEGPELECLWHSFLAYAPSICQPETPNPTHITPALLPHIVNSPKATSRVYSDTQYHHLQVSLGSPDHRARLHSIACSTAGAPRLLPLLADSHAYLHPRNQVTEVKACILGKAILKSDMQ
jgi:hypothetical protein